MFKDRKKIIPIFILVFVFAITALSFYFIGRSSYGINQIAYGKKYVRYDDVSGYKAYGTGVTIIINANGTIIYESYRNYTSYPSGEKYTIRYTVTYKYDIMDEGTLVAYYDSLSILEGSVSVQTDTTLTIFFSRNEILVGGTTVYVCEDYIDNIPNFDEPYNP